MTIYFSKFVDSHQIQSIYLFNLGVSFRWLTLFAEDTRVLGVPMPFMFKNFLTFLKHNAFKEVLQ